MPLRSVTACRYRLEAEEAAVQAEIQSELEAGAVTQKQLRASMESLDSITVAMSGDVGTMRSKDITK
eukprot:2374590-Amphidinium_carterae.1